MNIRMKRISGFTLIELMIVVVVISILASIAIPSYQETVHRAKRADAQSALMGLANVMERFFTENNTYCGSESGGTVGTCAAGAPGIFSANVPLDGGATFFNLTISAVTAVSYTLTATRTGSMTGDKCGDFTLTHTGVQGLANNTDSVANCWR